MPVATADLAPVVERIRTGTTVFRVVDFAATFEALRARGLPALPASFVMPEAEATAPNKLASGVSQEVTVRFAVWLFAKYAGDALGGRAIDLLKPLRDPLFEALLAWQPAGADGVVEFAGGRMAQLSDGILVWRDAFAFNTRYRRIP